MVRRYFLLILALMLTFLTPIAVTRNASAGSRATRKFYAQNNIMFIEDDDVEDEPCLDGDLVDLGDNSKTALNYLIKKGYSNTSAAAIVGNLIAESGVVPNKIEGGALVNDSSWRLTEWVNYNKRGFGIAQWTSGGRQTALQSFADANGLPVISMEAQLGYLFDELSREIRGAGSSVANMNAMSIEDATFFMYRRFETPRSSFCTTNDKAGCYNNYAPSSYSDLSPTETKSAYDAFMNRLKLANSALATIGELPESTGDTTSLGSVTCSGLSGGSEGARKIVEVAKKMSWPNADGTCDAAYGPVAWKSRSAGGVTACAQTINDYARQAKAATNSSSLDDCGHFVGTVMVYSGVDPDFERSGVMSQINYMNRSQKWTKVSTDGQEFPMSSLQPGDVLAFTAGDLGPEAGHIQIWIGEQTVAGKACDGGSCKVNIASASYQSWTPSLNYTTRMTTSYKGVKFHYNVYRLAASADNNIATDDIEGGNL